MTLEHAASGRLAEFMEINELNWEETVHPPANAAHP
jgi:hypothetical protein